MEAKKKSILIILQIDKLHDISEGCMLNTQLENTLTTSSIPDQFL